MRSLVVSDVHLFHGEESDAGTAFEHLVAAQLARGPLDVVLLGDIYDLAMAGNGTVAGRLQRIVRAQPAFHRALARVLSEGGGVVLIPGNHDYELLLPEGRAAFEELVPGARVQPWFLRIHRHTHVEHGNMYDPDNAHPHPLVPAGDPLGIIITRNVFAVLGDLQLIEMGESTPLPILWKAFVEYGHRTPGMVLHYLRVAFRVSFGRKPEPDAERIAEETAAFEGAAEALATLRDLHARPTHLHGWTLFRRLYLPRLLLTALGAGWVLGVTATALFAPWTALWMAIAGIAVLLPIAAVSGSPHADSVDDRLRTAAHAVAHRTGARHVVFGHTHEAVADGAYLNAGSFGFPRKSGQRPFVEVDEDGARTATTLPVGREERDCERPVVTGSFEA